MPNLRPALLALLLALAGTCVPGSSAESSGGQSEGATPAKKKTPGDSPSTKNSPSKSTAARHSSAKPASGTTASHRGSSGSKKTASLRSRRQPGQKAPTTDRVSEIQAALAKNGSFTGTAPVPDSTWLESHRQTGRTDSSEIGTRFADCRRSGPNPAAGRSLPPDLFEFANPIA